MSLKIINNGTFDNDPSADKIRINFDDVNANFLEQYTTVPQLDPATLTGQQGKALFVNALETAFELLNIPGGGDLLSSLNLSDVADAAQARLNLGLGTAAESASGDFATAVQGATADTALQSLVAGAGVTIDATDPINPIVIATAISEYLNSLAFDPSTGILTATLLSTATVTVDLSDFTVLKIDGYKVDKGSGNVNFTAWEVGDFGEGWDQANNRKVAFKVNTLPVVTGGVLQDANLSFATDSEI